MIKLSKETGQLKIISEHAVAPNIALIKYWGKYEENMILPLNSSLSITLNTEDLCSKTKVAFSKKYSNHQLFLNNKIDIITQRILNMINFFLSRCKHIIIENNKFSVDDIQQMHLKIKSTNNFPTASGLASSASGLACLAVCLKSVFNFEEEYPGQMTEVARLGSGSACRSLYGGIVKWNGVSPAMAYSDSKLLSEEQLLSLSKQCIAEQFLDQNNLNLKELEILILAYNFKEKEVKSTVGMQQSFKTSQLLKARVEQLVPPKMEAIKQAFIDNDWNTIMEITSKDSNQFHAVCLDTKPPIFYLNSYSQTIIAFVEELNTCKYFQSHQIGYTFDAGPHAVLLVHSSVIEAVFKGIVELISAHSNLNEHAATHLFNENAFEFYKKIDKKDVKFDKEFAQIIEKYKSLFKEVGSGPIKIL